MAWLSLCGVYYFWCLNIVGRGWTSGSCWAHAAVSSLADRHKILRKAKWPDIQYSVQVLVFIRTHLLF